MTTKRFVPLEVSALRDRYGRFFRRRRRIRASDVPLPLRTLCPYAEVWGVGDDGDREELVEEAPPVALDDLIALMDDDVIRGHFNDWLGADDADTRSEAYQSFSCLRLASMSADGMRQYKKELRARSRAR